jgi:hypothetical protein
MFHFAAKMATIVKNRKIFSGLITGHTTGGISTKLYRSDQYHP